jgi:hypothetical protein
MEYLPLFLLFAAVLIAGWFYLQRAKSRDATKASTTVEHHEPARTDAPPAAPAQSHEAPHADAPPAQADATREEPPAERPQQ